MRVLVALALLALSIAGCEWPSHVGRGEVRQSHLALRSSLNAVPRCLPSDYDVGQALDQCRYERAAEQLDIVRQSELGTANNARLFSTYLVTHQSDAAVAALNVGQTTEARALVGEAEETLGSLRTEREGDPPTWSDAAEKLAVAKGRLALADGDRATARRELIVAGRALAAPTQLTFGPNVTLARDLLAAGDTASVLAYFAVLDSTWTHGIPQVAGWRDALDQGSEPDFGANLLY